MVDFGKIFETAADTKKAPLFFLPFVAMAVPKKKTSRSATKTRHSAYQARVQRRLSGLSLVACAECGKMRKSHEVCPFCGVYRGRQVGQKATPQKTRIQA